MGDTTPHTYMWCAQGPCFLHRLLCLLKVNMRYPSCDRTVFCKGIKKNEKDYRSVARKLNTGKLEEKLMRIAVGNVTVNTNGHARPFLHFRLREEGRIDDDDVGMMGKHFPVTEDTVRLAIFMRNLKCSTPRLVL